MEMIQLTLATAGFAVFAFLLALIIIVFVHEFGHFIVGRWCGVTIETFSIGFGREIFGFFDSKGTRWKLCWIPLGGYVRFKGDANAASLPTETSNPTPGSLQAAALWQRAAIVAAGPLANFVLAVFIFAAAFSIVGTPINEPRVDDVVPNGAAAQAGIQKGDFIRTIDGKQMHSFFDIRESMLLQGENSVLLGVERGGQMLELKIVPKVVEEKDESGRVLRTSQIGIKHEFSKDPVGSERLSPVAAVGKGIERTWFVVSTTMRYMGKIFAGSERPDQLHGPVGVAQMAGESASMGVWPFVTFIALISVSIGLVNLFPVPMLDGGHLVFYAIEGVLGKPVGQTAQEWSFRIGLSAMLVLMLFATANDVSPYVTRIFGWN